MKSNRILCSALLCCAFATPAAADVTLKSKGAGTGMVGAMTGDMTQYVKGQKSRIDQTTGAGRKTTTIIDLAAKQMIVLDHDKKEAQVIDMKALSESIAKVGVDDITATITPTPATRQIAGQTCNVYDVKVAVPMPIGNSTMTMVMSGPQCLVKNGPGQADYLTFYRAASENGGFLDPGQAKARPAAAKAMTDMNRKMAELGVPFATELKMTIEGAGPMADMMKKMANTITTEVIEVSTAPLAATLFDVPADYKVKK